MCCCTCTCMYMQCSTHIGWHWLGIATTQIKLVTTSQIIHIYATKATETELSICWVNKSESSTTLISWQNTVHVCTCLVDEH